MKKSLLVLALLFSLATFSQSPVDKSFPPEELFALGSYYYPEQWDSSQCCLLYTSDAADE